MGLIIVNIQPCGPTRLSRRFLPINCNAIDSRLWISPPLAPSARSAANPLLGKRARLRQIAAAFDGRKR
jgi:hypothetical protein